MLDLQNMAKKIKLGPMAPFISTLDFLTDRSTVSSDGSWAMIAGIEPAESRFEDQDLRAPPV